MTRVALLLNNPFTGDSRSWKLARGLVAAGCTVTVVARPIDGRPAREELDGFVVIRLEQPRPLQWLPASRLPDVAANEPVLPTGANPARSWVSRARRVGRVAGHVVGRAAQALRYLVLARQWAGRIATVLPEADVWQAEGLITLPVALHLRRRLGGRVVYDARDLHVESARFARLPGPWRWLLAGRERSWARSADATITANRPYAEVLERRLGVHAAIIFNGPETAGAAEPAPIRALLGLDPAAHVVLCLGNVAPGRGVEQLCLAMTHLPDAVLAIVGPGGSFRERLREEASRLPAAARIHFLPQVAPEDIPAWTAAADVGAILIQPTTLNHRLTTPTRLFDALGVGVPVVVSNLPGMAEIVRETQAGILCDPTDPVAIARAIQEIVELPESDRAALRERALAAARGPFAWDRQMEKLLEVYRVLLAD